jgi:DNA repair exonuclease SbcCD nuclease subunit
MSFRILCTGDIHLGRRPRLPDGLDARCLGPAAAWRAIVDAAVREQVDAIALTGDVVDETNRFFEAYGPLKEGVEKLLAASIPVVAVAGNHDHAVLARLADEVPQFRLLGRGGRWESIALPRRDPEAQGQESPGLRIHGWSFPKSHVPTSPLDTFPPQDGTDRTPAVAMLHCDLGATDQRYAPVALEQLRAKPLAAWLLGHIHAGAVMNGQSPLVLYPGSPVGLDINERGPHGPWLVTVTAAGAASAEPMPLAELRWEQIDVPLEKLTSVEELDSAAIAAVAARHAAIRGDLGAARAVVCRLALVGRSGLHRQLASRLESIRQLRPRQDGVEYAIESVTDLSRPSLSLEDIARSPDPAGLLARRLVVLDKGEPAAELARLLAAGRQAIDRRRGGSVFALLEADVGAMDDAAVRQTLLSAGERLLEELLAQKEAPA